ncbi:hypothetical protein [uncultured Methanobrevibacter sp.]|uniref:hypothetical protein n=1 Tax=uncultured Methanobrevibacter sp. TaxID=253161 RepID=UPI002607FB66|nr:hypothetical protein [uncultured Methanobrevibacter sp.]
MVLKNLFDNYVEFEEIIKDETGGKIDLENLESNPTTILPLLCVCKRQNISLENGEQAYDFLIDNLSKNVLFSKLPASRIESDETDFLTRYMENLDSEYGGYFALRTMISEIANNVYDHSNLDNYNVQRYILSNLNEDSKKLDICVVDDGPSIPGLFEEYGLNFENDCYSIEKAIGTFSTISDSEYERGNGLWTVIRLAAEGNLGEILFVSRNGCLHICGEKYKYYLFNEIHTFNGTLIGLRLNKHEIQNIYGLIEFNKPDSYKLGVIHDH